MKKIKIPKSSFRGESSRMHRLVSISVILIATIAFIAFLPVTMFGQTTIIGEQTLDGKSMSPLQMGGIEMPKGNAPPVSLPPGIESNEAVQQLINEYKNIPQVQDYIDSSIDNPNTPNTEVSEQDKDKDKDKGKGNYLYSFTSNETDKKLPIFGQQIFRHAYTFAPPSNIPVSADYLIGPDDNIVVMLSGRINERHTLVVNRDGSIYIPRLGALQVGGLKFREMQTLIRKKMEAMFGVEASVTMGALRSISVFILGAAARPGVYTVSSFDTLLNALIYAGGPEIVYPTLRGSFRNIQLKRQDKVITTFDVYELILQGDKTKDLRLQAGDVIFIPPPGPLVSVVGEVRSPAIYELKKEQDLKAVLKLAGGLKPSAFGGQVQVQRYYENKERIVLDTSWEVLQNEKAPFLLQNGDTVIVFPITKKDSNAIFLLGNVLRPGRYAFFEGIRISDVINSIENLKPETHMDYALVMRYISINLPRVLVPFDLGKALSNQNSTHDILLYPGDEIYIFNIWSFQEKPKVFVAGEVRKPGSYVVGREARIKDVLLLAGNLTTNASSNIGELLRVDQEKKFSTLYFNVGKALAEDPEHNLLVEDQDHLIIHSIWSIVEKKKVYIEGDINKPGEYQYTENMTVSDLIFRAGNLLPSAYLYDAEITSFLTNEKLESYTTRKLVNLEKALTGDPLHNIPLTPKDRLLIKRIPGWGEELFATLEGELRFPGFYPIKKGERLSSLLARAGGYTEEAYLRGAVFVRKSVKEFQQQNLDNIIKRLEQDLIRQSSRAISTAISAEAVQARKSEMEQQREFIKSLREMKATGRMQIQLAPPRLLKNTDFDIILEDGDHLFIPMRKDVIHVVGSVMSPGSYVFRKNKNVDDYINMAGRLSKYADQENIYIMKVDGSAHRFSSSFINWNSLFSRWELAGFEGTSNVLEPGDTIVVPERFYEIAWLRDIRDITQILMQIAVTAAVTFKLF